MKKGPATYLSPFLLAVLVVLPGVGWGQTPIVAEWNFENSNKRAVITNNETFISNPYTADEGSIENKDIEIISLEGGSTFITWVGGSEVSPSFAPNSGNWDNGTGIKYWAIKFSSKNFESLKVSSKQQSSNTGPRDFKLQYSLDGSTWFDVTSGSITVANNFTTGVLNQLPLPEACNDQDEVYLRWIMTTNTNVDGGSVAAGGRSRIDQLIINGFRICGKEETFFFSKATGTYLDDSFIGNDGVEWNYYHSRDEGTFPIDEKGLMLRRASDSKLETGIISRGIGGFSLQMRKAFTNADPRQLELYVNGVKVGESIVFGNASGDDATIHTFEINEINIPGDFTLLIKNVGSTITNRQTVIDNITWTCYIEPICPTTFHFYRSNQSGNWENPSIWQASDDGNTWNNAQCVPDYRAAGIIIRNGHTVTINELLRTNQTILESGGTLIRASGNNQLIIHDGPGDDLIVHGVFRHAASLPPPDYQGTIRVETGGMIEVTNNISHPASHYGTSDKIFYENGAIFYWNVTSNAFFSTAGETYFVNSGPDKIPIFRVRTPNINVGGGTPTIINGIFEVTQNTVTWQFAGTKTFRNGIIGNGTVTQSTGAGALFSGQFIINGTNAQLGGTGQLILNSAGLLISNTANVSLISNKTIAGGPVTLSGALNGSGKSLFLGGDFTVTASGSFPDASTYLVFNGSTYQNLHLAEGKVLNYVQINKPGGDIILQTPLNVSQILNMNQGNIFTNGNLVTLGTSAVQTGVLYRTNGIIFGQMMRWFSNLPNTGPESGLFPIGHRSVGSRYLPALIEYTTKPSAGGSLTAEFINFDMGTVPGAVIPADGDGSCPAFPITLSSEQGFWRFTDTHTFPYGTYDITLYPNYFDYLTRDLCKLTALRRSEDIWEVPGGSIHIAPDGTTELPIIKREGNIGFSDWGVAGGFDSPLPIELLSFTAEYKNGKVLLNWATGSEINNDYFTLERSRDAMHAEIIGFVEGAGNSSQTLHYQFVDRDPLPGISYYRLKQTDYDGSFEYSQWVAVEAGDFSGKLRATAISQPGGIMLHIFSPAEKPLQVHLFDLYGRVIFAQEPSPASTGQVQSFIPMPQNSLSLILFRVSDGQDVVSGKVIR